MSSKHILIIDSKDREITSQVTTDFQSVLNVKINNINKVSLKSFYINLGWYNITSANNIFSIYHPGLALEFTYTLAPGRYNIGDVVSLVVTGIQDLVTPYDGTFTMTGSVSGSTGLVTIQSNQNFDIVNEQSLELVMGYPDTTTLTGDDSYTATSLHKLQAPSFIKLQIDTIAGSNTVIGDNMNNFTFAVPLTVTNSNSLNDLLTFNQNSQIDHTLSFQENPISLQTFRVTLRDQQNEIIDNHGADWFCILELELGQNRQFNVCSCA